MNKIIDFIDIDVYNSQILVMYRCDKSDLKQVLEERSVFSEEEIRQIMKGTKKLFHDSKACYMTHKLFPKLKILSFNKSFESISDFHRIVSHECLHATLDLLDQIGIELSETSEEAYTYLMGHIFKETSNILLPTLLKELGLEKKSISKIL